MNNCWFLVGLRLQRYGNFGIRAYSDVTRGYSFVTSAEFSPISFVVSKFLRIFASVMTENSIYFDFGSGDDYAYHGVTTFKGMTKKDAVLRFNNATDISYKKCRRR